MEAGEAAGVWEEAGEAWEGEAGGVWKEEGAVDEEEEEEEEEDVCPVSSLGCASRAFDLVFEGLGVSMNGFLADDRRAEEDDDDDDKDVCWTLSSSFCDVVSDSADATGSSCSKSFFLLAGGTEEAALSLARGRFLVETVLGVSAGFDVSSVWFVVSLINDAETVGFGVLLLRTVSGTSEGEAGRFLRRLLCRKPVSVLGPSFLVAIVSPQRT